MTILMKALLIASATATLTLFATQIHAAESTYSDVDLDRCKTLSEPGAADEPSDFIALECNGYKEYPLYYKEGDLRQSVHFGYLDQEIIDDAFETFGPFNFIGKTVEWRLDEKGTPYAAILRYFIQNANPDTGINDAEHTGQVLVISRVGRPEDKRGCVIGYVDAIRNPQPNEMARRVADELSADFVCGRNRPVFHGVAPDSGNDPSYNFPGATDQ